MELCVVNSDVKGQNNQTSVLIRVYCFARRIAERGLSLGGSAGGVSNVLLPSTFSYCQGKMRNGIWGLESMQNFFLPLRLPAGEGGPSCPVLRSGSYLHVLLESF